MLVSVGIRTELPDGDGSVVARFALPDRFHFVHEPFLASDAAIPSLGHGAVERALTDQLRHSTSGTFLLTGFRGVGKTSVVARAIDSLRREVEPERHVVDVTINVARPMSPGELLFAVIRRVFEKLAELDLLEGLSAAAQQTLLLAYTRTSLQLAQTRGEESERAGAVGVGVGALPGVVGAVLGSLLPKLELSTKRSTSLATEASFLTYSATDVEHDFARIVRELRLGCREPGRKWRRRTADRRPVQLVVVIDELDKLTSSASGLGEFEQLLVGLKNVLTAAGAHFVFIAGPDVYDLAAADRMRGAGIYESVFAWQAYVPCMWNSSAVLLESMLGPMGSWEPELRDVHGFLRYRSRGIARRLMQEFNGMVEWQGASPCLRIDHRLAGSASFFSQLRDAVDDFLGVSSTRTSVTSLAHDRRRLGAYFVVDWIIASGGMVFDVGDIVGDLPGEAIVDASVPLDRGTVTELLDALVAAGYLDRHDPEDPGHTMIPTSRSASDTTYNLSASALAAVEPLTEAGPRTLPKGSRPPRPPVPAPSSIGPWGPSPGVVTGVAPSDAARPVAQPVDSTVTSLPSIYAPSLTGAAAAYAAGARLADGYVLGRLIGSGAMGSVYEAEDTRLGRAVAIKLLERNGAIADFDLRARFEREFALVAGLRHPGVVATYEKIEAPDGRLGLVMELVRGPTLADLTWPVEGNHAVTWGAALCRTLAYLHSRGIARIDLKPANVIVADRGPVIVDLGLAKQPTSTMGYSTLEGIVGTPAYMAPEQIDGHRMTDIRADLYSLGVVLFDLLGGQEHRPPLTEIAAILRRTVAEDLPVDSLACSDELRDVLRTATRRDPDERYASPEHMESALLTTPEASSSPSIGRSGASEL
jgi:serine/threonine-protein kinase